MKIYNNDEYEIIYNRGHYTVNKNGVFYGNYDTIEDAKYDIMNEDSADSSQLS